MKYSHVVRVRTGVLHADFPQDLLMTVQMDKIQREILQLVLKVKGSDYYPRFPQKLFIP